MQGCLEKKKKAPLQGREGCCPLSHGLGMHIMYTVCGLPTPPVSVHLERRWEEGNANKQ